MEEIDISKLDKAEVLAALYNASKPLMMGFMDPDCMKAMTKALAEEYLKDGQVFDYLQGRVMKIRLDREILDPWMYDRDNGAGAAARALKPLFDRLSA